MRRRAAPPPRPTHHAPNRTRPATADTALDLPQLRYRWPGADADILQIDTLPLAPGETVFLRGPSGGDKSTLLSLAAAACWPPAWRCPPCC